VAALLALGWGIATGSGVLGLYAAYRFDLPTGAAIICALGAALLLCGLAAVFLKKKAF
jgi:zinc/manganese transport system permease protein